LFVASHCSTACSTTAY